jgi:hypothetical protein
VFGIPWARFNASRNTPASDELERLVTKAGFLDVDVTVVQINVHLPRIDKFVLDHLAATPVASAVASTDEEARKQIGVSVMQELLSYTDGDGITYPEETYVVTAQVR